MHITHFFLKHFWLLFLTLLAIQSSAQEKILLNNEMLYNFSTKGDAGLLIDEQFIAGDPANNLGGEPNTVFSPGWIEAHLYYPAQIAIDLGVDHALSELWFFDTSDADSLFIYTGNPSQWILQEKIVLDTYNTWRSITLNTNSQFLMLSYKSPSTRIAEIVLYGTANGVPPPPPVPVQHLQPVMNVFMGVNGFINDPISRFQCIGSIREYHNWGWDEGNLDTTYPGYPNNQYAWNPSWVSGPGWGFNFDEFYTEIKNHTLSANPALQGSAPYITDFNDSLTQHKPLSQGENAEDPFSYIEHADYMFQFAARYGHTAVDASLLKLKPDQEALSGLGLLYYLENWNEPDKWWFTRGGYFSPIEFATMCSADYDGHEGALGINNGMKNADPHIKMVMGGLATLNLEYVRSMKIWSDYNRQNSFPADVLNFHHYSENGLHGISPEEDSLKYKLKKIVDYRDQYLPGKEIWLSEFGYDTNPESVQASRPIDTTDGFEVQGQWILRSYLEAVASGIDRAHVFMLRDVNAPDPNKYNSSGLTGEIWYGHQPKKSWYYVYTMKNQLSNMTFQQEIPSGDPQVNVYQFRSENSDTLVYAVWCTTSENLVIDSFQLQIGQNVSATLITPVIGDTLGLHQPLPIENGTVSFRVSERPVFVKTIPGIESNITCRLRMFNSNESALPVVENSSFCIQLFNANNEQISEAQCFSAIQDSISFGNLQPGMQYKLRLWEQTTTGKIDASWMWNNWGGVSALDALIVNYMAVNHPQVENMLWIGIQPYSQYFRHVADVNNSGNISSLDALIVLYRTVGYPGTSPYPGGRHNFQVAASLLNYPFDKLYPLAPDLLFEPFGIYQPDEVDSSVYYELQLESIPDGFNYLNIYLTSTGDVNVSYEP
ncbi:MAG: hypothetical protein CVT92_04870 [Bacteroidetes bacterium HGW-Bacteroidetes-1]|jgi:hypothetical protein|nr:MAG: hypothetical protein CVT92_04870 [Bacteroidetes bacterium HGW-Bacteroidetes-1]